MDLAELDPVPRAERAVVCDDGGDGGRDCGHAVPCVYLRLCLIVLFCRVRNVMARFHEKMTAIVDCCGSTSGKRGCQLQPSVLCGAEHDGERAELPHCGRNCDGADGGTVVRDRRVDVIVQRALPAERHGSAGRQQRRGDGRCVVSRHCGCSDDL